MVPMPPMQEGWYCGFDARVTKIDMEELEREIGSNAMDPGQILSKQGMERFADVEVRSIRLPAPAPW